MKTRSILALSVAVWLAGAVPAASQMMSGAGSAGGPMGAGVDRMGGPMGGRMGMMGMMGGMGGAGAGCPGMAAEPAAFAHVAPWISMALASAADLGLTEDQVKQLTALRDDFRRDAARITGEIRGAELELARLLRQHPVDLEAVEGKVRAITDREAQFRIHRVKALDKGWTLLTAEQRDQLVDHDRWMRRMHGA